MVAAATGVVFAASLLLCALASVDALECYECNSHNDPSCGTENIPESFKKDCSQLIDGPKYKLCRKIVQYIDFEVNGNKPEKRVIRKCGWDDSSYKNACYHRSGFGGRQEVCACDKPLCNSAPASITGVSTVAIIVFNLARFFF